MNKFFKFVGLLVVVCLMLFTVSACNSTDSDDPPPFEEIVVDPNNGEDGLGVVGGSDFTDGADNSSIAGLSDSDLTLIQGLNFPVVYFPYDSNEIVATELKKIEQVATYLKQYTTLLLIVEGHCDQRGTEEYNRSLGERRANMIREHLENAGVEKNRIRTVSYGKDRPAVEGNGESAWGKNRRGELLPAKKKN